jgi:hypothetical protein
VKSRHTFGHFAVSIRQLVVLDVHLRDRKSFCLHFYYINTYKMVAEGLKNNWIEYMCSNYLKLPRFMVGHLAESYASDGGKFLREKRKGRMKNLQGSKQRRVKESSPRLSKTQTGSRFQGQSRWRRLLQKR